jgi:hypothetical protein
MSLKCWCPSTTVYCVLTEKQPLVQGVPQSLSLGIKQPVLEADHFYLSGARLGLSRTIHVFLYVLSWHEQGQHDEICAVLEYYTA